MTTRDETIIDSHHHFWDMGARGYPWMPPPPSVIRQDYMPEDMAPLLRQVGVSRTVLVQAHQSIEEAHWMLDIAEATDFVAGVVAWADLTGPDLGRDPRLVVREAGPRGHQAPGGGGARRDVAGEAGRHRGAEGGRPS